MRRVVGVERAAPYLVPRAVLSAAATAFLLTVVLSGLVLPGLVDLLPALPAAVQLFVLIGLSSSARVLAGVVGARRVRRDRGTVRRSDAFGSVLVGNALAWVATLVLTLGTGTPAGPGAMALDLLRWMAEGVLGALCVTPGDAADDDYHGYS